MFHNLSDYDAHVFIKELGRRFNKNDIGSLQRTRRNTSVLTSSWLGLSVKMIQKRVKIFNLGL